MTPVPPILELTAVGRRFGPRVALQPVSLRLQPGTICVVTGANGAGKTTLLRLAAGLLAPSTGTRCASGSVLYLRPGSGGRRVQRVDEAARSMARLASAHPGDPTEALDRVGLAGLAGRRVLELSSGQRARLSLALLWLVRPELACLDEPTASLDEFGRTLVRDLLLELVGHGCTFLVATHDPQLLPAADAHLLLAAGRVAVP